MNTSSGTQRPTRPFVREATIWLLALGFGCSQGAPGGGVAEQPDSPSSASATPTSLVSATAPALSGQIVYAEGGDVYRLDLPDGVPVRLTEHPADKFDPDLSPDGGRIAYRMASGSGDEADIWVMNADGSDKRNLTMDPSLRNWAPAWSPDGSRICFNSTRNWHQNRIWLMNSDGTGLDLVPQSWGEYCYWSPDGQRIVYAAALGGAAMTSGSSTSTAPNRPG